MAARCRYLTRFLLNAHLCSSLSNVIFGGAYYDSLILAPTARHPGNTVYSNAFMAKFSPAGNLIWSKVDVSIGFVHKVCYTFEISDTVIIESGKFACSYSV